MAESVVFSQRGTTGRRRLRQLFLLAIMPIGLAACSLFESGGGEGIEQKVSKEVWRSRESYVRIENQDAPKGIVLPPNQHPVTITPEQIRNALDSIRIEHDKKDGPIPLFSDWELDMLSKHVSEGLAQAAPNQDVTFAVVGWHKALMSLKVAKLTTGRMFYAGGQLNLIVGSGQRDANNEDWAYREMERDRRLDPYIPGMRSFTLPHQWRLSVPPNAGIYAAPNTTRTDWLVFT
ncbi:MAG: hypothetical protein WCF16_06580, partial [Alphaproteobacteria bacterium]